MKQFLIILSFLFLAILYGCSKPSNKLTVTFARVNPDDSSYFRFSHFKVRNDDTLIFKNKGLASYDAASIVVIDSLPDGNYYLEYTDLFGKAITKSVRVSNQHKILKIITDSVDVSGYYNKTPIQLLKDDESYTINGQGGCVTTMYTSYTVRKLDDKYYLDVPRKKGHKLSQAGFEAIRQFEAELLAIEGFELCQSTGAFTYTVEKNSKVLKTIKDRACNWNGLRKMFFTLNKELPD